MAASKSARATKALFDAGRIAEHLDHLEGVLHSGPVDENGDLIVDNLDEFEEALWALLDESNFSLALDRVRRAARKIVNS